MLILRNIACIFLGVYLISKVNVPGLQRIGGWPNFSPSEAIVVPTIAEQMRSGTGKNLGTAKEYFLRDFPDARLYMTEQEIDFVTKGGRDNYYDNGRAFLTWILTKRAYLEFAGRPGGELTKSEREQLTCELRTHGYVDHKCFSAIRSR